jgi:7-cyano-7-deazaguanine reductase
MNEHTMPLGKAAIYKDQYDPSLLFPIARQLKRAEIGIATDAKRALPFFGVDVWNCYELSWLNPRGKPHVAIAVITVPADSANIIESKSLKLYFNSFNNTKLENEQALGMLLQADLSEAVGATVSVRIINSEDFGQNPLDVVDGQLREKILHPLLSVRELEGLSIDRLDVECSHYMPEPNLLTADKSEPPVTETLTSNLLKSNCLVTGQPDWGSIQIQYSGPAINQEGLLRYLVSFRNHNEFHEQCVERIFMDILTRCQPNRLAVYARYTRRGGIDINPYRANFTGPLPANHRSARQ